MTSEHASFVLDAFDAATFELNLVAGRLQPSPRLNTLYGYPDEHPLTLADCLARHHPDDQVACTNSALAILARGEPRFQTEFRLLLPGGEPRWVLMRGELRFDEAAQPVLVRGVLVDISERKRREASSAFLAEIMSDFAPLKTAEDIMRLASTKTAAYFGLSRCVFVEINEAADKAYVICDHCEPGLASLVGTYRLVDFHTDEERRRLGAGRAIIINNVAGADRAAMATERFIALGIGALVNAPYVANGRWQFVLSAMQAQPRTWRHDEVELLQELSARIWPRIARARAEEALRESEGRYRTLLDSIDQAFCLIEMLAGPPGAPADYRFLMVNRTFEHHTGLRNVVGKTIRELVPDLEPHWIETVARVAATGEPRRVEAHSATLGRWFELEAVRVGAAERQQVGMIFTDITARRQADTDLHFLAEVSEQSRTLDDAGQLLDSVARLLSGHLHTTRCFFATLDEPGDRWIVHHEFRADAAPHLIGEHQLSAFPAPLLAGLCAGQRIHCDDTANDSRTAPFYRLTFEPLAIRAFAMVKLRHAGGRLEALLVGAERAHVWTARELLLIETVAERTWNAVERLRLAAARHAYAARLQRLNAASLLLNAAPSHDAVLQLVAREARELIGAHLAVTSAATDQGPGQRISAVSCSTKYAHLQAEASILDMQAVCARICRSNSTLRLGRAELKAQPLLLGHEATATAHMPPAGLLAAPFVGRDGQALGLIQLADKTEGEFTADDEALLMQLAQVAGVALENQRLYAQEQAARVEAEQANRLKDEFLATVSHELRTPLTAFLGFAQLLQRSKWDEAYVARTLAQMMQSAKAQAVLIEDLLDVSRIVSGKLRIHPTRTSLCEVIETALDTVRPTLEAKALQVQLDLDPAASVVQGDANRLQQVVWNLVSNAAKFTRPGGQIVIRLRPAAEWAELSVRDTGQGISAEFLPYVFDRFRQADSSSQRAHSGLGLGLTIVRHLVELHGGTVTATSEGLGWGATFTVRLPLLACPTPGGEGVPPA